MKGGDRSLIDPDMIWMPIATVFVITGHNMRPDRADDTSIEVPHPDKNFDGLPPAVGKESVSAFHANIDVRV